MKTPRCYHWWSGARRIERHAFGNVVASVEYLRPLCGRWMTNDGQFASEVEGVTCDHCRAAIHRLGEPGRVGRQNARGQKFDIG